MSFEPRNIQARHLLVCREIAHNPDTPGSAYSLVGLIESLRPADDFGYLLIAERPHLFAQLFGDPGEYDAYIDLVYVDGEGNEVDVESYGPRRVRLEEGRFVQGVSFPVGAVRFPRPGLYEFRLWVDGVSDDLIRERLLLEV